METKRLHVRINGYLSSLKTDSDKLTQFYDAAAIAKLSLLEVDSLKKALQEIIEMAKSHGYAGKMSMKHIAQKALGPIL